ncbi:MAG TPA: hypothetical protein VFC23_11625 [Thermoanaerobaculia bacterium]|nr:hypothetical protein [Thermoanaerobaculia bacterium]
MSGKRSLKKQQKRQATALAQLGELYRRGADDEFLARAAEQVADLAASPFAAQWAEVADRALRQSLARADLGRLDRLLRALRKSGPPRPLAILGEGVLDLAAGRLDAARSRLATVAAGVLPPGLLADLQALAQDSPDLFPEDPYLRAAAELFAAFQGLDREAVARSLRTLRSLIPEEPQDAERRRLLALLDASDLRLLLLAALEALATRLSLLPETPEGTEARASRAAADWLRGPGPSLAAALAAAVPPLLAPLQHAVRTRWRSVLERVAAEEGPPGLAALCAADPGLLAHDVDLQESGRAGLRQRAQAQQLLATGRYAELAQLLRSRSRAAVEPGDLAALWSLELWACQRMPDEPETEDDEDWASDLSEPSPHATLVRLGEMATEVGRRFPAEQRAEVARVLRDELFDLCEAAGFCDHTAAAALSLLEHQPGDLGLLIAGVAGAIVDGAPRALHALEAQIERRGPANAEAIAHRLLAQAAQERSPLLARILDKVRPLFSGDAWPEVAELVAREMGGHFAQVLCAASFQTLGEPELARRIPQGAREVLALLRPALGGTRGFAATELTLDCCRPDRPAVEQRLARFLAGDPGCEGVLVALQVVDRALMPWMPKGLEVAFGGLAEAAIDRLDDRWQLWGRAVPLMAAGAAGGPLKRLEKKVRQLLASPAIPAEGREVLEEGLQAIRHFGGKKRGRPRRGQPKGKPRRRRGDSPQLRLDV